MVVDKTRENCQSWQVIRFPARPVVYIRIVGTRNTANEVSVIINNRHAIEALN